MHWRSKTNGVFDIEKQAVITANMVVDLLIGANIVSSNDGDNASAVATKTFLSFRTNSALINNADIKEESGRLAQMIVAGLIEIGIVKKEDRLRAFEIAEEETFVQRILEAV